MSEPKPIVRLVAPPDYIGLDPSKESRLQGDVSSSDYNYVFKGVLAGLRGSQVAILGQLFKKFTNELRSRTDIPDHYDDDNERKVAEILERCTFGNPVESTTARNVGGGTKKVRTRKSDAKGKRADIPSESPSGV